jgi:hypothetical protein
VGALANLGYVISDQTVGNILHRHALPPAPERSRTTTWPAFIRTHLALLAGTDFFTAEVLTLRGLVTYYVLFFIQLESRRVDIAGITIHPDEPLRAPGEFIHVRGSSGGRYMGGSQSNRGDAPTAVVRGPGDAAPSDAEA